MAALVDLVSGSSLLSASLCLVTGFAIHTLLLQPLTCSKHASIPGPKLAKISRHYLTFFELRYARQDKIAEWHRLYGPVVMVGPNEVSLADPGDFHEIYDIKAKFDKPKFFKQFTAYDEDNLFSTEKYIDHQIKKRKIASDYSKSRVTVNTEGFIQNRIGALLEQVKSASDCLIEFFVLYNCFAHDVVTRFLLGESSGTDAIEHPADRQLVMDLTRSQLYSPIWVNLGCASRNWMLKNLLGPDYERNGDPHLMVKRHVKRLMQKHEACAHRDNEYSLFRTLRHANIEWAAFPDRFIASELFDGLDAGQLTTASTLTYISWYLSRHRDWQERLQAEVCSLLNDEQGHLPLHLLEDCQVLDSIVRETMRLHPTASNRSYRLIPDGGRSYSGVFVPGGTVVFSPNILIQRNSTVFKDPDSWQPERWMKADDEMRKQMDYCWVPFGYGARICIGQHLAWMEMKMLIASLYRSYSTHLSATSTEDDMTPLSTFATLPKGLRCELYVFHRGS